MDNVLTSLQKFLKVFACIFLFVLAQQVAAQEVVIRTKKFSKVLTSADQRPVNPGGKDQWASYISKNMRYPELALENKVWGMVYVAAIVGTDGFLYNLSIERGLGSGCDEESLRLVSESQQPWQPALMKGKPVDFRVLVPVRFRHPKEPSIYSLPPEVDTGGDDKIYTVVEKFPQYPGGDAALREAIQKTQHYPSDARKEGVEGTVYISFIIDKNGNLHEPKVELGPHPSLDDEAVRVISSLDEKWTPGMSGNKPVNYRYLMPIRFKL